MSELNKSTVTIDSARTRDVSDKLEQKELAILHLIHSGVNNSRLELARLAGLSPASITTIVQRLMMKGLVVETAPARSHLGRRPVPLEIRRDAAYLVGIDLGSFYLRIVITDINGNILHKFQTRTEMQQGANGYWKIPFIPFAKRSESPPYLSPRSRESASPIPGSSIVTQVL